jgi:hypothetical protein
MVDEFKEDAGEGLEQTIKDCVSFHALRVEFSVCGRVDLILQWDRTFT